jgi:hypothetical protein
MLVDLCRHIKTSGTQCRGVALTGSPFCYFHHRLHSAHAPYRRNQVTRGSLLPGQHIELAPLEDRDSVLLALSQVVNALATGSLETKRATALFRGLQIAAAYAPELRKAPEPVLAVRTVHTAGEASEAPGVDLASPGYDVEIAPGPDDYLDDEYDLEDDQAPLLDAPDSALQLPGAPSQPALPSHAAEAPIQQPPVTASPQTATCN